MRELLNMSIGHSLLVIGVYLACIISFSILSFVFSHKIAEDDDEAFLYILCGVVFSICLSIIPAYLTAILLGYFRS